jgi:glycosyltransferase involved in cell wall biosynthesis
MKILHFIPSVDPRHGGPIEGVTQIGKALQRAGIRQELLTLDPPGAPFLAGYGDWIHAMGSPPPTGTGPVSRFRRWANFNPRARDWACEHVRDYDAVVVNSLWNYSTRIARLALAGSGVPYVVYPHGMLDPWFRKRYPHKHLVKQVLWWFNEGILLRHADRVLFTCEQERLLARKTFFPYRAQEHVIAYGAAVPPSPGADDPARFRAMVPTLGERRYLLFLSRIHEKKGCDLLVEGFARQAGRDPDLDLVIAGPDQSGLAAGLKTRAGELGIKTRIHWPGMITGAAKYGALRGAAAFILPSHQENFGIAVAEALSCRCPVLISDQVNIWREVVEGGAGFAAPDTVAGVESLLERFFALDGAARERMAADALAVFEARFNMERGALELIDLLRKIAKNRKQLSYK